MIQNAILTEKIIGCAYRVYNAMGFGYLESVYEKCMLIELADTGLAVANQHPISVLYNGEVVGDFYADLIIDENVIVELKSVKRLNPIHEAQLVNYLVATRVDTGLLINFGEQKVEIKRKVRDLKNIPSPSC